jgi:hypothetical protein
MNCYHPNIAMLYGYSLSYKNYYLLCEWAERGSLDEFWKDDTGREQLSLNRRIIRIIIAYEVLNANLFLHETFEGCFHRDIKSAKILLTKQLKAKLIVNGFDKLVASNDTRFSCVGVKGTPGYVCPEYLSHGDGYDARCDIFSFGVVLTELLTGKLQNYQTTDNHHFNFLYQYIIFSKRRNLVDDIDSAFNLSGTCNLPKYVHDFADLAIDCMALEIMKRPAGNVVMNRLESIKDACTKKEFHIKGHPIDKYSSRARINSSNNSSDSSSSNNNSKKQCDTKSRSDDFYNNNTIHKCNNASTVQNKRKHELVEDPIIKMSIKQQRHQQQQQSPASSESNKVTPCEILSSTLTSTSSNRKN